MRAIYEKGLGYQLTNNRNADSSIFSRANCVNRNTCVHSISNYSGIKHAWTAVTNRCAIKVEMILSFRTGICLAVQRQNIATKYCPVTRNGCEGCCTRCIFQKKRKIDVTTYWMLYILAYVGQQGCGKCRSCLVLSNMNTQIWGNLAWSFRTWQK